jgi:uncharacterized membrane protein
VSANGQTDDLSSASPSDNPSDVILSVVNHESKPTIYTIKIFTDGAQTEELGPEQINVNDEWDVEVSVYNITSGVKQKVSFFLFRDSEAEPYLTLYLLPNTVLK